MEYSHFEVSLFHSSGSENFLKKWTHEWRNVFITSGDLQELFDTCSVDLCIFWLTEETRKISGGLGKKSVTEDTVLLAESLV